MCDCETWPHIGDLRLLFDSHQRRRFESIDSRIVPGEIVYHALNRANGGNELSHNGAQTAGELDALRKSVNRGVLMAQKTG
jgi:hypothetical protein